MHYRYIILTIICTNLLSTYVISQTDTSQLRGIVSEECFGITKYDDEYIIRLNGVNYSDKEKAYICENDLSMSVEILYKHNAQPVNGAEWDWSDCECNPADPVDHTATISILPIDNFAGDNKLEISIRFEEQEDIGDNQDDEIGLVLYVVKLSSEAVSKFINISGTRENATYEYDENEYDSYPSHGLLYDFKVIPALRSDIIEFKNPDLGGQNIFSTVPFEYHSYNTIDKSLTINNILETEAQEDLVLTVCDEYPLIYTNVLDIKNYIVEIYTVCESDDDKRNYYPNNPTLLPDCITPISDYDHDCIAVGDDGSLDLFTDISPSSIWQNRSNDFSKPSDRLEYINPATGENDVDTRHNLRVKPSGTGTAADPYYCNSVPRINNSAGCGYELTEDDVLIAEQDLNTLYNKVNVNFEVAYKGTINLNYDVVADDAVMTTQEQIWLHTSLFGDNYNNPSSSERIQVWVVPQIAAGNVTGYGRATDIGDSYTLTLSEQAVKTSHPDHQWRTLAHEIGHCVFSLHHPDNDPGALMLVEEGGDSLSKYEIRDKHNVMNSGSLFYRRPVNTINKLKLRHYQWTKF